MSFTQSFAEWGDAPALVFAGGTTITYAVLAARIEGEAARLGTGKRLVALQAEPTEQAIVTYLAALHAGHAVTLLPPGEVEAFTDFCADIKPEIEARRVGARWHLHEESGASVTEPHADLAVLLGTSGSTGKRKYVRLSRRNIESNAEAIGRYLELTPDDRGALILPYHYSYGLSVLNAHLAVGASVFIADKGILEPGFLDDIRAARCSSIAGVPYSYELLEQIGFRDCDLPDLRFMTVAGGRLAPELVQRYGDHLAAQGKRFFVMYGQTEATARIAYLPPERLAGNADKIGVAIPGGSLRLADEQGNTIEEPYRAGELLYRGPNVMMGYAETRDDLARGAEVEELNTEDLAERDEQGLFRIVGRKRRMSKIGGLRIGHEALEFALAQRGIRAAVVGDDQHILAAYEGSQPEEAVQKALIEVSGLPAPHLGALSLKALPRLASGKVDYPELRGYLDARREHQKDPTEADSILEAFRHAFYPRRVEGRDSFHSLGGDSLLYVQLSMALEKHLGKVPQGWEKQSIGSLSKLGRQESWTRNIDTTLALRALACLLIIVHHATHWPIPGGAAALVMLVGYSLARFQGQAFLQADFPRILRPVFTNMVPYYLILVGYAIAWEAVPWPSVFLVSTFGLGDPVDHTMLPFLYWFVEIYLQMVLVCIGLFAIPQVRGFARTYPYLFGLAFLGAAVALRFGLPLVWDIGGRRIFAIHWSLYIAAFGWCVFFADTLRKKLLLLAAGAVIFPLMAYDGGNWTGAWVKYILQFLCGAVLLFAPRLTLPKHLVAAILPVSAASYHLYLFHRFPPELIPLESYMPDGVAQAVAIVSGIITGLAAYQVQQWIVAWLNGRSFKPIAAGLVLRRPEKQGL